MKTVQRTECHIIRGSHPYYAMLRHFCHLSKNLYNHANYVCRSGYLREGVLPSYGSLDKMLKQDADFPDYRSMPTAQCAQQTLRYLCNNWKSFHKASEDWKRNPAKYLRKPKMPKYLEKDGCYVLALTNQNCKLRNGTIRFPKAFKGFTVKIGCGSMEHFVSFQQVRIVPKAGFLSLEVVYDMQAPDEKPFNGRAAGVDLGADNLAVIANNFHGKAVLVNGRPVKSMNQYYNKRMSALRKELMKRHGKHVSKRILRLTAKRNAKVNDYMHKASRSIINWCLENNVTKFVVGRNKCWKQECRIGYNRKDQNFVGIPFYRFEQMLAYKAENNGISVVFVNEAFTSGTSAIDNEPADPLHYDVSRRIKRGLFRSGSGILINADLNAAYQILKHEVPFQWDRGCVLHPVTRKIV